MDVKDDIGTSQVEHVVVAFRLPGHVLEPFATKVILSQTALLDDRA